MSEFPNGTVTGGEAAWVADWLTGEVASEPQRAAALRAALDRRVMALAPWVPLYNATDVHLVSKRAGNCEHHPQWGVLRDQLWLR